jgi:Tfp pilus assembly protein PilF
MGNPDAALAALEKSVSLDPKLPDAHYHLAVLYQQRGEEEKSQRERQAFDELEAIGENKTGF